MPEPAKEQLLPFPDWSAQVLKQWIRTYRYTGDNLQGTSPEKLFVGLRRGDRPVGTITLTHVLLQGRFHLIRLVFQPEKGEPVVARAQTLDQMKDTAMRLMEQICKHGCSIEPSWCDDCFEATRHKAGNFRTLQPPKPGAAAAHPQG